MNIVDEVFEEIKVENIIEEMCDESSDEDQPYQPYLMTVTASVIVVRTLQKLVKK